MIKWLHHLFNPHCSECAHERDEARICQSCETLKNELAITREQNQQLLNQLLRPPKEEIQIVQKEEFKPLISPHIPWSVKKQMLEQESRVRAKILKEKTEEMNILRQGESKSVEEIEKELGIVEDAR